MIKTLLLPITTIIIWCHLMNRMLTDIEKDENHEPRPIF